MTDPNHPVFSYGSYLSSSEFPEDDPAFNDWATPPRSSQPPFTPQVNYEPVPGFAENPGGVSHIAPGERPLNTKVPIPRSATSSTWTSSGRVSRACENCREQKAKCSGHRPTCHRCQESGIQCSYGDRKREKMAKQLSDLTNQVQVYEALLQDIYPKLDTQSRQHVEQVLNEQNADSDQPSGLQILTPSYALRAAESARVSPPTTTTPNSSFGALDYTNEDFNRDERVQAMGFVGEHSEIAWMHRLKQLVEKPSLVLPRENLDRLSVASMNFFLDDSDIPLLDDVDLSQRPSQAVADRLVDIYFQVLHPSFPIIGKVVFLSQYKSFYSTPFVRPGRRWLAILNLVFAISAKYLYFDQEDPEAAVDDSSLYFSRAWRLSMSDVALLNHPNLQQVQVEGLTSFYLLAVGQLNRSWRISGISMRSAVKMGLNLRSESNAIAHVSKETRYRVWWSLYMLDLSVCVMTGRPPSSCVDFCTTPVPVPFTEEDFLDERVVQLITDNEARNMLLEALSLWGPGKSTAEIAIKSEPLEHQSSSLSKRGGGTVVLPKARAIDSEQVASRAVESLTPNFSLYFLYLVELSLILREAVATLYAPGVARKSWHEIEMAISTLNAKVDAWHSKLPDAFHFTQGPQMFERQRINLAFRFYSTKILINQPCLSRLAQQAPGAEPPGNFCVAMAAMCVDFASQMINLLPALPNNSWIYRVSPWWLVLHYLMQATTVLLTELLVRLEMGTVRYNRVLEQVTKVTSWLAEMSTKDPSSHRAWLLCEDLISHHAPQLSTEVCAERNKN